MGMPELVGGLVGDLEIGLHELGGGALGGQGFAEPGFRG